MRLFKLKSYKTYKTETEKIDIDLEIEEEDLKQAIIDYKVIYASIKKFVDENKDIRFHEVEKAIINQLEAYGAHSKERAVNSKIFRSQLLKQTDYKLPTLQYHFYKLRDEEIIKTIKGQYDSEVWLAT